MFALWSLEEKFADFCLVLDEHTYLASDSVLTIRWGCDSSLKDAAKITQAILVCNNIISKEDGHMGMF